MSPAEQAETTAREEQIETTLYDNVKITDTKRDIVEYLARNPNATNREVAEAVGCSISYPSPVRDQYADILLERARELGSDLDELKDSIERRTKKRADTWESLTSKQRAVLRRLAEEPDPKNPNSSLRGIIEDLDFETYPTYVTDVMNKYGEYAVKLQESQERASESQDPEELISDISLDEKPEEPDAEDVTETEEPVEAEDVESVSQVIESLRAEIKAQKRMAKSEMDYSSDNQISAGKLVMAEQMESKLEELTS